jgi:hypothetical protein
MPVADMLFSTHADRQFAELDIPQAQEKDGHQNPRTDQWGSNHNPWDYWSDAPCVVLLGEPGSGKTTEFLHQFEKLNSSGHLAFIGRWQNWFNGDDVFETLPDRKGFFAALESGQPVWWFLDALDEGRIKTERAFDELCKGLRDLQRRGLLHLVKLRVSCRSRDWRPSETGQLSNFFPFASSGENRPDSVFTLQLLPLDEAAIRALAVEKLEAEDAVSSFMDVLSRRHVMVLAGHPLLLSMMLSLYSKGDASLGSDRTGLYKEAVERLVTERNPERKDQKPLETMPQDRIAISQALAVRVVLGGKDIIAVPDTDSLNDRTISAECSGAKRFEILETLNTGLFTQNAQDGFSFSHRSLAEYLTASYLSGRLGAGLPLRHILPLFPVEHGMVPSPLRETAAWLAGLSIDFRRWLMKHDPVTAAQGDTVRYTKDDRECLILALADRFNERNWQREFDRFGDLARSVSETMLRQLLNPDRSLAVRCMVMEMINAAEAADLFPALLSLAMDSTETPLIRAKAVDILGNRAPDKYIQALLSLLRLPPDQDPADEIAGGLLYHHYPKHITTEQALFALRIPRQSSTFGYFRWFWEVLFLQRIPNCPNARLSTLNALAPLLTDDADTIALRPFDKIFLSLMKVELESTPLEVERLGPWLVQLAKWITFHGVHDQEVYESFLGALKATSGFATALLRWRLTNWSDDKEFLPWSHLPFHEELFRNEDIPTWVELCHTYADHPKIGIGLFNELIGIAFKTPASLPVETIEELALLTPAYRAQWEGSRVISLDCSIAKHYRKQVEYKIERDSRETGTIAQVRANIELFQSGQINALTWIINKVPFDFFDRAPLKGLTERYGSDVANAVRDGLVQAWANLNDTSSLWPMSNSSPGWTIVVGMGFRERYPDGEGLASINEHQVDYLIWRMLYNDKELASLLRPLWECHHNELWSKLNSILAEESKMPEDGHPIIWARIAAVENMPTGLKTAIVDHIGINGLPTQAQARRYALRIVFPSGQSDLKDLVTVTVRSEWCSGSLPTTAAEPAALVAVAAWWLLAPSDAYDFLVAEIFRGERHHPRVVGFVNALQDLQGRHHAFNSKWSDDISWDSYAKLLPLLYDQPPKHAERLGKGWVGPEEQFEWARNSLVEHLTKAPGRLAKGWFASWKNDPRYGEHRDWFASLHAEIEQRHSDESWSPLELETIDLVLGERAALVRNDGDVASLLDEVIATKLIPAYRADYSLVPLLWDGSKSAGDRMPKDEKALQTAIYGQLMPMLYGQRMVGAREPEVFDAKKPDVRISYILDMGSRVDVPIEIKWAHHPDVWEATEGQVFKKYMVDPHVRYALYLVGWAGGDVKRIKTGPNGEVAKSAAELQDQLQQVTDTRLHGTGKNVTVHVIDVSLIDE